MGKRWLIFVGFILIFIIIIFVSATQTYLTKSDQWQDNLTKIVYSSAVLGDIDNDGDDDLISIGNCGTDCFSSEVYTNNGTTFNQNQTWSFNLTDVDYGSLTIGDIDNDGDLDLALSGCNNGGTYVGGCGSGGIQSFIYINNGTTFNEDSTWQQNLTKTFRGGTAFGDIDNDGDLDLIFTGQTETTYISKIYINNGTTFNEDSTWQQNLTAMRQSGLAFGDIDNDGDLDLVLSGRDLSPSKRTIVYTNNGSSFNEDSTWQQNLETMDDSSVSFADFDNDGDLDLSLTGCCDEHRIYRNNGSTFIEIQREVIDLGAVFAGSQAFGDYDNDGYLDLIVNGREEYTFLYLYNSSSTNFTKYSQDPESHIIDVIYGSLVWGDLDNDNDLDLIEFGYGSEGGGGGNATTKGFVYISNRSLTSPNTQPSAPSSGFSSTYSSNILTLNWGSGSDTEAATSGLYYNLMVGNETQNHTIVSGVYGGFSGGSGGGGGANGYFGNMMQRKSISLNVQLEANKTYNWYVQTIDTGLAKSSWSEAQSFTVGTDTTAPVLTSISSSKSSTTATITWTSDESSNSTVYYGTITDTSYSSSSASLVTSHSIGLSGLSASTLYYYNVSSCDSSNNCNTSTQYNFTTSASGNGNNGGTGSGGGGGTVTTSFWSQTYSVSDSDFEKGIIKELSKKQRVKVSVNNESHYIGIIELTNTTATINITSNPIQVILGIGDDAKLDILDDGFYDIYVLLNSINNPKVNLTIQSIHEEIPAGEGAVKTSGEDVGDVGEKEKGDEERKSMFLFWGIVGVVIILIIILVFFFLKKYLWGKELRKRRKTWQK